MRRSSSARWAFGWRPPWWSAHELGAPVEPTPFSRVLRGLLLTGGAPLYLRAELDPEGRGITDARQRRLSGHVSSRALWWPPGKVAGRYLAPYLSTARPVSLGDEPLVDRVPTPRRCTPPPDGQASTSSTRR